MRAVRRTGRIDVFSGVKVARHRRWSYICVSGGGWDDGLEEYIHDVYALDIDGMSGGPCFLISSAGVKG